MIGDAVFAGLSGGSIGKPPLAEISEEVAVHSPMKKRQDNPENLWATVQTVSRINFFPSLVPSSFLSGYFHYLVSDTTGNRHCLT